ncbi:MAG: hypothetical protein OEX11_04570 [Nitrosomonas sp.]|nr:hypothetical protein [Nitrosomonas sp.]
MRILILAVFFSILTTPIYADDKRDNCTEVGEIAASIMKARQAGMSLDKMMQLPNSVGNEAIVIIAYDKQRQSTELMQNRSVNQFREDILSTCEKNKI